jgi:hypothetical protein
MLTERIVFSTLFILLSSMLARSLSILPKFGVGRSVSRVPRLQAFGTSDGRRSQYRDGPRNDRPRKEHNAPYGDGKSRRAQTLDTLSDSYSGDFGGSPRKFEGNGGGERRRSSNGDRDFRMKRGGDGPPRRMSRSFEDGGQSYPQYGRNSIGWEEKGEPAYGYYEGDHLYGIAPVRLALLSGRRQFKELLVQEGMDVSNKKDVKAATDIMESAKRMGLQVREFSKHDLNMITDNKLHQGFVLRAEPLDFERLTHLESVDSYR